MGMGELIGMRWILWEGADTVPKGVLDALRTLVERVLSA
jgi:hypothetical protein